jgi:arsenate reductase (thioredoxin)
MATMRPAFFNATAEPAKAMAISAGTEEPAVNARSVPTSAWPRRPPGQGVAVPRDDGLRRGMPVVPGAKREGWPLQDPKGQAADAVKRIRDEVRGRVRRFVEREGWARS